jgi:hypothetical protein
VGSFKPPREFDGRAPVGLAGLRALHQVDNDLAPFLKRTSPNGGVANKRNGFDETHQGSGSPYLIGGYTVLVEGAASPQELVAALSPEDHIGLTLRWRSYLTLPNNDGLMALATHGDRYVYVGDNYVMKLLGTFDPPNQPYTQFWPAILRCDGLGDQYLDTDPDRARRSTTFINTVRLGGGLQLFLHSFSLFGSGWHNDEARFRFGLSCLFWADDEDPMNTKVPVMFIGNTGDQTMEQVAYPVAAGRNANSFTTSVVGPGKLRALHTVEEDITETMIPPYVAASDDHGLTWTSYIPTDLLPYVYVNPAVGGDREYLDSQQLAFMSASAVWHYVGDDTSILFIPNGYVDGELPSTARFAPMLFKVVGTNFERISWPPDEWYTDKTGLSLDSGTPGYDKVLWTFSPEQNQGQYSVGVGCLHVPVRQGGEIRMLHTRDFGATWEFSPPVPDDIVSPVEEFLGAIVKPYIEDEQSARLVYAAPDYEENRLRFLATDENFEEWKGAGAVVKAKGALTPLSFGYASPNSNYSFVNFGGRRYKPCIFPAFPGEFDRP